MGKACALKRAAHKSFSVFSPSSTVPGAHSASEACCRRSLYAAPSVEVHGQGVHGTRLVHTGALLDSHLGPRGPTSAQGPRAARLRGSATRGTRAASHQAPFLPPPRPASRCARVPVGGRRCSPWVSAPRPIFRPSLPEPKSPGCRAAGDPSASCRRRGARSHRSLPPRSGYRLMKCSFSSVICFVFLQSSDK